MTGLLLLAVVGLWAWACFAIARGFVKRFPKSRLRLLFGPFVFLVLLVLPVADEIVGGFQFRSLCAKATLHVGVSHVPGRIARYSGDPIDEPVPNTAIPILRSRNVYIDTMTSELIARYDDFVAKGGLLIRALGISATDAPLTIGKPFCSGKRSSTALPLQLNFRVVN